jgi:aldose 1-epimerase
MSHFRLPDTTPLLKPERFQGEVDGQPTALYTLRNSRGMIVCITNLGAKIEQLIVPDRDGRFDDVVLGYDSLDAVMGGAPSMGAFIGRYAGRIANAGFMLRGKNCRLNANNGPHCLHGGIRGSRFRVFDAMQPNDSSVEMSCVFSDGEEGFPGTLALRLTYSLTEANELVIEYEALALDKPTVASFTTHAFFNLDGASSGSVLDHEVTIFANSFFAMSPDLVATGEILPVEKTVFDFRQPVVLGERIDGHQALTATRQLVKERVAGYDSCYLVNRPAGSSGLVMSARVCSPGSGRAMEVWSTEPTLQLYTGMVAGEPLQGGPGKGGLPYFQQQSICLEPQGYPNAPNCPAFPSALHEPGQSRAGMTLYRFGVDALSAPAP